jgi:hypothetical protein
MLQIGASASPFMNSNTAKKHAYEIMPKGRPTAKSLQTMLCCQPLEWFGVDVCTSNEEADNLLLFNNEDSDEGHAGNCINFC